jgi:hypothetical protein
MGRLPWFGKVGPTNHSALLGVGYLAPASARVNRPGLQSLCPALAFLTDLAFERYEHPFADSLSSLGWSRDLPPFRSIGEIGPAVCGLPSHGLPGGSYFAKSRNLFAVNEIHR